MPNEIKETLRLISYRKKNAILVGSQNQKDVTYKNDYDLFETIVFNKSRERFILDVHKLFIKMVKEVKKNKNIYFIEFKGGIYEPLYISNEDIINKTRRLAFYTQAVQNGDISNEILRLIQDIKSKEELLYFCSNLYKVRWSIQDILNGYVILFNTKKFLFKDVFNQPSVIKIDVMLFDNTEMRFVPFSNYFEFINKDKEMNVTQSDIKNSLQNEADDLAKSGNYFKSVKRLYSLALYNKDKKQAAKYLKVINSLAGTLYFVRGNIENCIEVLKLYKKKKTLEEVHLVLHSFSESYQFDKTITGLFEKAMGKHTHYGLLKALVNLESALNKKTQTYTKSLL
jgi:hypothetical protein